ncbi:P-loop ATPase, Sll1717 family [Enterobacter kobei]|uniref:P-loop ATPase, Sll1717 family n=1 Tax=Enterobacter kobei TaxID=208224 RepID=UPI002FD4363F
MNAYKFRNNDEIGKLEAETDSYLDSCFYESNVFKGIINFDSSEKNPDFTRRIIVGRTGSGKSALLKKILAKGNIKIHDTIEAENTIFEHINNNVFISDLITKGIDLRGFYKSLWLHVLLMKVIPAVYRSSYQSFFDEIKELVGGKKKPYKPEIANEYIEQFKENFFNEKALIEISDKLERDLSFKLGSSAVGIGGKISNADTTKIQSETSSYVSRELLFKQKELIKILKEEFTDSNQVRIVISIDDLDKSWLSTSAIRYDFINALLEAFRELLDIKSVKVLISIRTDILMGIYKSSLRQDEKDQSLIYSISWNKTEIREVIDARINHLVRNRYQSSKMVTMRDIFNFNVSGICADDYILDRTMLRPRDAINFVNICLSECDGLESMNEKTVLIAEEKFYSSRKRALVTEWKSIYPFIEEYLDALSLISETDFSPSELDPRKKDEISQYLLDRLSHGQEDDQHNKILMNFEELLKVWFVVGVIGIQKTATLVIYSSFDKPNLDITDMKRNFKIHPLFDR